MNYINYQNNESRYLEALRDVLTKGTFVRDRTGTGTLSMTGVMCKYPSINMGFPLLTTKKMSFNSILGELLWFLNGDTNTKFLTDNKITIWDEWADENGDLGPIYGHQWRNFGGSGVDQIRNLIVGLQRDPLSRRHIVSAWNPTDLSRMALPPCHSFFQLIARPFTEPLGVEGSDVEGNPVEPAIPIDPLRFQVSLMLYQRSADMFLGVPYNIASYCTLLRLICMYASNDSVKFVADEFTHVMGDCHIYSNHIDQVKEQLSRSRYPLPGLKIDEQMVKDSDYLRNIPFEAFSLRNYTSHPAIKAPVAV